MPRKEIFLMSKVFDTTKLTLNSEIDKTTEIKALSL